MERYICIHGHFYQPPRENAWLEAIELQDSAYPYHDWNERVTEECYAPNAASRILNHADQIVKIVNNYARISFNFGPTLLRWLEDRAPDVYQAILAGDQESQKKFSGYGSAIAQAYNHLVLPLANPRDKYTQVLWGIRDFEHRFGRSPEGMWLPETAVDLETLEILAQLGLRFTILAPQQARRVRKVGEPQWQDVSGGAIDPSRAYLQTLPSGRQLSLFFYDDRVARATSFESLLHRGEHFVDRLMRAFSEARDWPQLVHIATDGETYGHHHRHGDMALAYALDYIESNNLARLTNYGEYLHRHPPTVEVDIIENTSWSCAHGLGRWSRNCGCRSGQHPEWNQTWRVPLRQALNWLRDTVGTPFEELGRQYLKDPWAARNEYIEVVLDRSAQSVERFLRCQASRELDEAEKITALKLLELQRHAMLMYTSCGWFFDDLAGIETLQVIHYAGRVLQLAQELFGSNLEPHFLYLLSRAKSNLVAQGDGRDLFERVVRPAMITLPAVSGHYALSSLFEDYRPRTSIYCYAVEREDYKRRTLGGARVAVGRARFTSEITHESALLSFGALHFGNHNLIGAVGAFRGEEAYQRMVRDLTAAFTQVDFPTVIQLLQSHFGPLTYSLRSLFRDEQRKVMAEVLRPHLTEVESIYRQLYTRHAPLLLFLADLAIPLPKTLQRAAECALNSGLQHALELEPADLEQIAALVDEAGRVGIVLDRATLGYTLELVIQRLLTQPHAQPADLPRLQQVEALIGLARSLPFEIDLWKVQNIYYEMLQTLYPDFHQRAAAGDATAQAWVRHFLSLGGKLRVRVADTQQLASSHDPLLASGWLERRA